MRKDFSFSFKKHPVTKDISVVSKEAAVKQSLKNIVLTSFNEKIREPAFGGNVRSQLAQLITPLALQNIKDNITNAIEQHEPDVDIIDIGVATENANDINVVIIYNVLNSTQEQVLEVQLAQDIR